MNNKPLCVGANGKTCESGQETGNTKGFKTTTTNKNQDLNQNTQHWNNQTLKTAKDTGLIF